MSSTVMWIGVGVCFTPALVALLAHFYYVGIDRPSDRWSERIGSWTVYSLIAVTIWCVIALAV